MPDLMNNEITGVGHKSLLRLTMDLHTHTRMSHGTGTIEDNVRAALARGLTTIAITDHGFGHRLFGIKPGQVEQARRQIDQLNDQYRGQITILLGVEANLMDLAGKIDISREIIQAYDIILLGFHRGAPPTAWPDFWQSWVRTLFPASKRKRQEQKRVFTQALIAAMQAHKIDILSHPGHTLPLDIQALAEAAHQYNTALEVNCKHHHLNEDQARLAAKTGVHFAINSDAHSPDRVGMLQWGLDLVIRAGIPAHQVIGCRQE